MAFSGGGQHDDGSATASRAHFVLVPMMAQGHAIPMADLARLLAERGARVSVAATPVNASRMASSLGAVRLVELRFPAAEFGLPEGCENLDQVQSRELLKNFIDACAALREPLAARLRELRPPATCVVSDVMHWWTGDIARELGIPRLMFTGFCGFSSLARHIIYHNNDLAHLKCDSEVFTFPGFPTPLELTKERCPGSLCLPGLEQIREKIREEDQKCDGMVMNSFQELEARYIESLEEATGKKVWAIGPMCLCHHGSSTIAARGSAAAADETQCLQWLDSRKPGSVIFVSFGSLACTTPQQLVELGMGLESSKKPFIWVIKAGGKFPEVEEWLAGGFEERVKDRGMIIRGWAPQVMILWHRAIGVFVTHCGWNSTIEGVCAGVPMITWPHFAEQFVNERLVVDVLRTGVEIGVKGVTQWGSEPKEVMVTRDAVETAVSTVMDEGEAAEEMRIRAKEFGILARRALDEGGSSYNNIKLLIQEMGNKTSQSG